MASITEKIKADPRLKSLAHRAIIPKGQARPRWWVRWFVNPFKHKKGRGAKIRRRSRLDVFPFRNFSLGAKSIIEDFATINNGVGDVIIGKESIVGLGCVVIGPVTIGDNVMLAQNVVVSGLNHGYQDVDTPISKQSCLMAEIVIDDESWIGANSVLTAGVHIGRHSVVAAGSVVTKNVPDYTIVAGNPAVPVKQYNHESKQWEKLG